MVASGERPLRMLVVHARFTGGFHVAMVPADLLPEQIEAAFKELGIDAAVVLELSDWKTAGSGVAVACHGARKTGHVRARYTGHLRGEKIRHLAFNNPLLKESLDDETTHDGRSRHDPYTS